MTFPTPRGWGKPVLEHQGAQEGGAGQGTGGQTGREGVWLPKVSACGWLPVASGSLLETFSPDKGH